MHLASVSLIMINHTLVYFIYKPLNKVVNCLSWGEYGSTLSSAD